MSKMQWTTVRPQGFSGLRVMQQAFVDVASSLADARRIQAEFVLTELELGLTFLDIAANTGQPKTTTRCVRNAIEALRTANRFLIVGRGGPHSDYLRRRRDELRERLEQALFETKAAGKTRRT
jgi:hypothetical protein